MQYFKADGYDEGTARSQCGQMMNRFNVLHSAKRDGNKLDLNESPRSLSGSTTGSRRRR